MEKFNSEPKETENQSSQLEKMDVKPQNETEPGKLEPGFTLDQEQPEDNAETDVSEMVDSYVDELKELSPVSKTLDFLNLDFLKNFTLEKIPTSEVTKLRDEFNNHKEAYINAWEKFYDTKWPVYEHDVVITTRTGEEIVLRHAGDRYDAHHIIPISLGGGNKPFNITPMHVNDHKNAHCAPSSKLKTIEKMVKG